MRNNLLKIFIVVFLIVLCSNTFCMTDKMQSFIEDDRFKDGISWDNREIKGTEIIIAIKGTVIKDLLIYL